MTYPRFRQIAAESPTLLFELATQLASRLDRTNRKLGDLAFVDVTGRVAHAIMDLCNEPDAIVAPRGHADQGEPPGALAPGRLLARDGGPRAQGARGAGTAHGARQDHGGLRRAPRLKGKAAQMSAQPAAPAPLAMRGRKATTAVDEDDEDEDDED